MKKPLCKQQVLFLGAKDVNLCDVRGHDENGCDGSIHGVPITMTNVAVDVTAECIMRTHWYSNLQHV